MAELDVGPETLTLSRGKCQFDEKSVSLSKCFFFVFCRCQKSLRIAGKIAKK